MRRLWCCSAGTQACDLVTCESKFLQNFIVMLADSWRPPCRHLGNTVHLNRTADGRGQLLAGSFELNDDVIRSQLRIIDDFLRLTHGAEGDVNAVEDFIPMRHWLRTKNLIEHCRQLRPVLRQLGRIRESRIRQDVLTIHCLQNRGYLVRSSYKNE